MKLSTLVHLVRYFLSTFFPFFVIMAVLFIVYLFLYKHSSLFLSLSLPAEVDLNSFFSNNPCDYRT